MIEQFLNQYENAIFVWFYVSLAIVFLSMKFLADMRFRYKDAFLVVLLVNFLSAGLTMGIWMSYKTG